MRDGALNSGTLCGEQSRAAGSTDKKFGSGHAPLCTPFAHQFRSRENRSERLEDVQNFGVRLIFAERLGGRFASSRCNVHVFGRVCSLVGRALYKSALEG